MDRLVSEERMRRLQNERWEQYQKVVDKRAALWAAMRAVPGEKGWTLRKLYIDAAKEEMAFEELNQNIESVMDWNLRPWDAPERVEKFLWGG